MATTTEEQAKIQARIHEVIRRLRSEHAKLQAAIRAERWHDANAAAIEVAHCTSFLHQFSNQNDQSLAA